MTTSSVPVAGARVVVWQGNAVGGEIASGVTDGEGAFSIPGVRISSTFGAIALVSQPGYFIDFKYVLSLQDARIEFSLEPWVHIAVDQVIRGRVGDVVCEGAGPCQRYAFTPPTGGVLELTAPAFPFDLEVLKPDGLLAGYAYVRPGSTPPLQLRVPVDAGVTYEIHVIYSGGGTRDFVLTTGLR